MNRLLITLALLATTLGACAPTQPEWNASVYVDDEFLSDCEEHLMEDCF
ncbi:MAG: hypothetical protein WCY93_10730 [Anaerolineaceae bacterium]